MADLTFMDEQRLEELFEMDNENDILELYFSTRL